MSSCHHGMAHPQVTEKPPPGVGGVCVANILNKSQTADEGLSSSLGARQGAKRLQNISQGALDFET
jgi:hypothetical protein